MVQYSYATVSFYYPVIFIYIFFICFLKVAALVLKSELEGEMGDAHMALQARLMSQALRKLSHSLSLSQTILIFINQVSLGNS